MEVSEAPGPDPAVEQSVPNPTLDNTDSTLQSESVIKGAAVSVIQAAPPKCNGVAEVENGHEENGEGEEGLHIQQPTEQLPAELLQEDTSLTTVASLIDKAEDPEVEAPQPEVEQPQKPTAEEKSSPKKEEVPEKTSVADLESDWSTEDKADEAAGTDSSMPEKVENAAAEAKEDDTSPRKSGRKVKPTEKVLEAETYVEESVEAIANELATGSAPEEKKKPAKTTPKKSGKGKHRTEDLVSIIFGANGAPPPGGVVVGDKPILIPEESGDEDAAKKSAKKPGRKKKKDLDEKVDNVTKLGNNMYFYTGPGGQDSPPPLNSDDEDMDLHLLMPGDKAEKEAAARKSNRAGKGRNPRLEREDEEVEIPKKLPPKPNLNPSWLKTAAKNLGTEKKTPGKKKPVPQPLETPPQKQAAVAAPPLAEESPVKTEDAEAKEEEEENKRELSPPKDEELPEFDPAQFTPGYVPKTVKKGEDEYVVIVQGVQDTGLCGKYWGDISNLSSRRRSKQPEPFKPGDSPEPRGRKSSVCSSGSVETPGKKGPKKQDAPAPPKSMKKQVTKPESVKKMDVSETESAEEEEEPSSQPTQEPNTQPNQETEQQQMPETPSGEVEKKKRGRKRKVEGATPASTKKQKGSQSGEDSLADQSDNENKEQVKKKTSKSSPEKTTVSSRNAAAVSAALAAGVPAGQQRSVSCVSDTSTQKEVVVECFAPYDDHRWVNIGKERDGMTPDAVQYARALRPPYHLLSFLRIKGHSTKGMSCTDKNTMVFVVLEGEITVILHTTQFNAKKGDSFYIPPKNYYNLINQKAREAELSLIQFQYDGPLPTVNPATSQSQ